MCWDSSDGNKVATNARLPTGRGGEWCGMECGGRGPACGARGRTYTILRKAQGTHGSLQRQRHHVTHHSLFVVVSHTCPRLDTDIVRVIPFCPCSFHCSRLHATCGCAPDGRWHMTKPLHQPTTSAPPPHAAAGEEVPERGRPSPSAARGPDVSLNVVVGNGSDSVGFPWWPMDVMTVHGLRSVDGDGQDDQHRDCRVWTVECDDASDGSGDDGIGGLRIHGNTTDTINECHTMRCAGRSGGGLAFVLTYTVWIVSAFVTFVDHDLMKRGDRRASRKKAARMRRAHNLRRARQSVNAVCKKRGWVAVAPPLIGRKRLCRARPVGGVCWVIRIGGEGRQRRTGRHCPIPRRRSGLAKGSPENKERADCLDQRGRGAGCPRGEAHVRRTMADACRSTMGTLTIGQAGNPGPPALLRWASAVTASVVTYAAPGKEGFHGAHGAGHVADDSPPHDPFVLKLATANTTGWRALQAFLCATEASVVFAQEHRLLDESIPMASAWARKHGWKSVWAPAVRGSGGGASAGTVVLTKNFIGLRHPDRGKSVVVEGRAVAAVIEPPASRPFIAYAAYYHHGQGLSRANLALTADIGSHWEQQADDKLQMVIGADFNMAPATFAQAGLAKRIWGRVVAPHNPRGTCRSRWRASTYDYFFMTAALADLVDNVATKEGTGIRTHTPVIATFLPRLAALKALSIRAPPSLPLEPVFGPRPPPPRWRALQRVAEELVHFVRAEGDYEHADRLLTETYAMWMNMAEEELADVTGACLPKWGCRSQGPRFRWKSVLPEVDRTPKPSGVAALAWLMDVARDATRVPDHRRSADADELRGDELINILVAALKDDVMGKEGLVDGGYLDTMNNILAEARSIVRLGEAERAHRWSSWSLELEAFLEILAQRHSQLAAGETAERTRAWKEWLRDGFESGARHAFAYLRLPSEWRPTTVEGPTGLPTADPARVLEGQRDKFVAAWTADDDAGHYVWRERAALPRLSPSRLREASLLFKKGTAIAYDGVHCRHYSLLCDEALETLGTILEVCELLGTFPKQCRLVLTPLLEKPKGGYRPVAIYVSLYRLWTKARRDVAATWEAAHQRPYFSASKGNGPADTTWRQAVRQEARLSAKGVAACLYWDLEAFYESVDRERLFKRAEASGFPMPVLRLALAMYSFPRALAMGGRIAKETWPKRGVGAGCGIANTLVKVFTLAPMDEFVARLPSSVTVDLHVDDFALECIGDDERQVARDLAAAQALLHEMVLRELGAKISVPKAALVASTWSLAHRIREAVGQLAGPVRQAAPNLGLDATAAKRRGARATGTLRQGRWRQAVRKRHRLRAIASAVGVKAGKVFVAGVGASAAYHAAVQGLTDAEMIKLRRLAAAAFPPRSRFRSLTLTHLYFDMPTAPAEVAATLQYARAVWTATLLGPAKPRHPGFDLPGIRAAWETVAERIDEYVDDRSTDPTKQRRWGRTRGPLAAAMLELHRAGWTPDGPFEWTDDRGSKVLLTETPPAMLKMLLTASIRRQAERMVGAKWAKDDPTFTDKRACIDAAVNAVKKSTTLSPYQKGAFRAVLLEGVLTKSRARKHGYDVDDVCDLCGHRGDTVHHRTYGCSGTQQAVRAVVPPWFWEEAQRSNPADRFWTTASMPHPADMIPQPRSDYLSWAFDAEGGRCEDPTMSGHVFHDGSCTTSIFRGLQRASMALVQVDGDAKPVKTVSIPIWGTLPQTPQAAEYAAYAGLSHVLTAPTTTYGDCKGVLDHAALDPARRHEGRRKYAGVLLSMARFPRGMANIVSSVKVKAHQCIENLTDAQERWQAIGNDLADAAAKEALKRHPQPSAEVEAKIRWWENRARHVVTAVATAMTHFPPMGGKLKKKPRTQLPTSGRREEEEHPSHRWEFSGGRWRCTNCWTFIAGDGGVPAARRTEACRMDRITLQQEQFAKAGHLMLQTEGNLPITFCARCGGWSSRRANRLSRPCGPPTPAGKIALRRIANGLHPWQARDAAGKFLPRGKLKVKAGPPSARLRREEGGRSRVREHQPKQQQQQQQQQPNIQHAQREGHIASELELLDLPVPMDEDMLEDVFGHGGSLDESSACHPAEEHNEEARTPTLEGTCVDEARELASRGPEPSLREDLKGVSMAMMIAVLRDTPKHHPDEHEVAVFNAARGSVISSPLAVLQREVQRRREHGIRDTDQSVEGAAHEPPLPMYATKETGQVGGEARGSDRDQASACTPPLQPAYVSRRSLVRHLEQAAEADGRGCSGNELRLVEREQDPPPCSDVVGCGRAKRRRTLGEDAATDDEPPPRDELGRRRDNLPGEAKESESVFRTRDELRRHLKRSMGAQREQDIGQREPKLYRARSTCTSRSTAECGDRSFYKHAGATGAVNSTIGAREGLGGTHGGTMTAAVAQGLAPGATAAVVPKWGAALLTQDVSAARPPSGRVAPLDGIREGAREYRPVWTSLQKRPRRLGAGPSCEGHVEQPGEGDGPPEGDREEAGGTKVPRPAASVARGDADATEPWGEEEPPRGSALCTLGALKECDARRMDELRDPPHREANEHCEGHQPPNRAEPTVAGTHAGEVWNGAGEIDGEDAARRAAAAEPDLRGRASDSGTTGLVKESVIRRHVPPPAQVDHHQRGVKRGCGGRNQEHGGPSGSDASDDAPRDLCADPHGDVLRARVGATMEAAAAVLRGPAPRLGVRRGSHSRDRAGHGAFPRGRAVPGDRRRLHEAETVPRGRLVAARASDAAGLGVDQPTPRPNGSGASGLPHGAAGEPGVAAGEVNATDADSGPRMRGMDEGAGMHAVKKSRRGDLGSDVSRCDGGLCVYPKGEVGDTASADDRPRDGAQEVGDAVLEFVGPARRRLRCKTAAAQEGDQRLGASQLVQTERQEGDRAGRCQVKTLKFPSSRSSATSSTTCAALDPSPPCIGEAWTRSSARGESGAAANGEGAPHLAS